ncbi:anti-sigma factor antagonist [Collinsella tanakaei]|uniref:anti-sigma factor antagonist n=1 Tax=Collinsella tanakaei TaxID=626935 RepID=UPI0025A37EA8|nr:anti-sigma factor antagonist [Collinsella tanakaei]MDM8302936.1 anti-sigma factor antagonist [Collinsella tanakaei]
MNEWNDIAVIAPARDIDIATVGSLRDQIDALLASGVRRILVNCQDVTYIDSSGFACLLSRARRIAQLGGMLSLVNTSPDVTRTIQIARLVDVLHVTAAVRPPVPVLKPDTMPLWSKSVSVREGVENLGYYRHRVSDLMATLPLSQSDRFDMALAVGEALSNAYDHADNAAGCTMMVIAYPDRVVIEVRDHGAGYEIAADEQPATSEERGRGIRLMRMLVDSVEVRRRRDTTGTLVRLIKLMGAPQAA